MADRAEAAGQFLANAGWGTASRAPLAGDASLRRYERLTGKDGTTAVLMDAPTGTGEDVRPFLTIARHLDRLGLSAPKLMAVDAVNGFLLLEDLGDDLFARVVERQPDLEPALYSAAADVLAELHRHPPPPGMAPYDAHTMPPLAALAFDWYFTGAIGTPAAKVLRATFLGAMQEALEDHAPTPKPVLVQRDYHAENLLWLPGRDGVARVGLLDFQDARAGHPGYDLISLVEDARRDVSEAIRTLTIRRYLDLTGGDAAPFQAALAVLGAQRNLRILGVFARLSMHYGKPHYVDLIPRVWSHLQRDLMHPALAPLARLTEALPAPTPTIVQRLKDLCGTVPTR